jgi:hypothetical protein
MLGVCNSISYQQLKSCYLPDIDNCPNVWGWCNLDERFSSLICVESLCMYECVVCIYASAGQCPYCHTVQQNSVTRACNYFPLETVKSYHSWVLASVMTEKLLTETLDPVFCIFPKFWANCCILIYTHCHEMIKSVGVIHCCSCWRWLSDTSWVLLTRLQSHPLLLLSVLVWLERTQQWPSKGFCRGLSAISWILPSMMAGSQGTETPQDTVQHNLPEKLETTGRVWSAVAYADACWGDCEYKVRWWLGHSQGISWVQTAGNCEKGEEAAWGPGQRAQIF